MSLEKWPWGNVEPQPGEHEAYSQAVSLKRIADTLERLVPDDPRESPLYKALAEPLNHYGENIGDCIQGQFQRRDDH